MALRSLGMNWLAMFLVVKSVPGRASKTVPSQTLRTGDKISDIRDVSAARRPHSPTVAAAKVSNGRMLSLLQLLEEARRHLLSESLIAFDKVLDVFVRVSVWHD